MKSIVISDYVMKYLTDLDPLEMMLYAIIQNYHGYACNIAELMRATHKTEKTIYRALTELLEKDYITVYKYGVTSSKVRNIYAANYDENGRRSEADIESDINKGLNKCISYYKDEV